jgi:hypothetical protein
MKQEGDRNQAYNEGLNEILRPATKLALQRHLNITLKGQMTFCFHLPACARRSPWPDFTEASDNNDFIERNNSKSRTTAAKTLKDPFVILNCGTAIAGSSDDNKGTT